MTAREIITEFILQNIRQGDLVEIQTTERKEPFIGHINDKDVFPELPVKLQINNIQHNAKHKQIEVIRITIVEDQNQQDSLELGSLISFSLPSFPIQKQVRVSEIIGIKKIES